MFFHFDNLSATLIASAIILIVIGAQVRVQDVHLEQTALLTAKSHALEMGDWLQQDMSNAGYGVPLRESFIEDYAVDGASGSTKRFSFRRKLQESDTSPTLVTYELIAGDTVVVDGETVQLYQLQRCYGVATCPAGSTSIDGQSPPMLTYFRIDLMDENGGTWTAGTSNAYYVRVRFSITSPMSTKRNQLREAHWGTVLPLRQQDA